MKTRSVLIFLGGTLLLLVFTLTLFPENLSPGQIITPQSPLEPQFEPGTDMLVNTKISGLIEMIQSIKEQQVRVLFENPNSIYNGLDVHFVNTSRGSLTFRIRDLVLPGHIPIVISRIYDSATPNHSGSIARGWKLSYDEYCEEIPNALIMHLSSGKNLTFPHSGQRYNRDFSEPNSYEHPIILEDGTLLIAQQNGWEKRFEKIQGKYRLIEISDSHQHKVGLKYKKDQLVEVSNDNNGWVKMFYDESGQLTEILDFAGRQVLYQYNLSGQLISVIDRGQNKWNLQYNAQGLLEKIFSPDHKVVLDVSFDVHGRVRQLMDEDGQSYYFGYEEFKTSISNIKEEETVFYHDETGRVMKVINAAGVATSLVFNQMNQIETYQLGETDVARFDHTENGNIEAIQIDGLGEFLYQYDERGNLIYNEWPGGEFYRIERDDLGQPTKILTQEGLRCQFKFDEHGDILNYSFGDNFEWNLGYDEFGNLSHISNSNKEGLQFGHDSSGNLSAVFLPNETIVEIGHDGLGRVVSLEKDEMTSLWNEIDVDGRILNTQVYADNSAMNAVLRREHGSWWVEINGEKRVQLSFDSIGNIVLVEEDGRKIRLEYGPNSELLAIVQSENEKINSRSLGTGQNKSMQSNGSGWRARIGYEEICSHNWEIESGWAVTPIEEGIYFDQEMGMFRVNWPIAEENRWVDYILQTQYFQLIEAFAFFENDLQMMSKLGLALNHRPPEFKSIDDPAYKYVSYCICYFTPAGEFIACSAEDCNNFIVDLYPIFPMDPPEEPVIICTAGIYPPFEHYIKKGETITFSGMLYTRPTSVVMPDWSVYWKGYIPYASATNTNLFTCSFDQEGLYAVIAGKPSLQCDCSYAYVRVVDLDLTLKDSLSGPVPDAYESSLGAYVHFNNDDDNFNQITDYEDNATEWTYPDIRENDLKRLEIKMDYIPNIGAVKLIRSSTCLKLWPNDRKGPGFTPLVFTDNTITWDLSNEERKQNFENLNGNVWVEGVDLGEANLLLKYVDPSGNTVCSDMVKYTFIAMTLGVRPVESEVNLYKNVNQHSNLIGCEWRIMNNAPTGTYNCIAWSADITNQFLDKERLDLLWGDHNGKYWDGEDEPYNDLNQNQMYDNGEPFTDVNGNGVYDHCDIDLFYWRAKGWRPIALGPTDAQAMYYSGYHAARRWPNQPSHLGWLIFTSKMSDLDVLFHTQTGLNDNNYGIPVKFYK